MSIELVEEMLAQLNLDSNQTEKLKKKILNFALACCLDSDLRQEVLDSQIIPAYRVWSKEEKKFLPPDEVAITASGKIVRYSCQDELAMKVRMGWLAYNNTDDYVVQRYTEVQDKDNNPIYEGDIVVYNLAWLGLPNEVTLEDNSNFNQWKCEMILKGTWDSEREIKIVGNIFENPSNS